MRDFIGLGMEVDQDAALVGQAKAVNVGIGQPLEGFVDLQTVDPRQVAAGR
jgi:hypothetical protein